MLGIAYFETSALDNSDKNINKAFMQLVESNNLFFLILDIYRENILNKILAMKDEANMRLDKSENISTADKKKKGCC